MMGLFALQAVHQMHRDHVPSLPPSFELLGSTPACAIHGMVRLADASAPFSHTNISAVTLQGALQCAPTLEMPLDVKPSMVAFTCSFALASPVGPVRAISHMVTDSYSAFPSE